MYAIMTPAGLWFAPHMVSTLGTIDDARKFSDRQTAQLVADCLNRYRTRQQGSVQVIAVAYEPAQAGVPA